MPKAPPSGTGAGSRKASGSAGTGKPAATKTRAAAAAKSAAKPARERPARRRNREQTIHDILDAAEALLDRKGPDGFGLAELGRDAGVSFGLIHHYFGGKEGLLRAVLQRTLRQLGREVRRIQEAGELWDADAPAVVVVFDTYLKKPGFARLMSWGLLTGLLRTEEASPGDREALDAMVDRLHEGMGGASRAEAAALTTLLTSAVLGFNLLRPLLVQSRDWNQRSDEILREQLVRAMTAVARPKPRRG